jgi:ribonuclease J
MLTFNKKSKQGYSSSKSPFRVRFISLGGIIGVTKNMYVYELYEEDELKDILIIDCGIGFPREKELGVDFVIPDITYLKDKTDKIRAILLSHGHEDHISGLPFHYDDLGNPPVYTSKLTAMFVENKFKEFKKTINVTQIEYAKDYKFGGFTVNFIHMTHSIPDTMHILIKTPVGNLYHGTDFKMDLTPAFGDPPDFYQITKAGHDGVLCLLSDSLGSEREGLTLSESIVGETFDSQMAKTKGKFIMTTFSSNISRIRQCVEAAIKYNRKIIFLGRSMRENTRLASEIGYLPIPHGFLIKEDEAVHLPPNKVCLIVAGSQGQYGSAVYKLATKQNKYIQIKQGDKVVFSSDPIPGNENEVYGLIEELSLQGAEVIYSDIQDALHASGHGNQDDIKFLMRFTKPKHLIPIGSTIRHQRQYQKLAMTLGHQKENVHLMDEGETLWFTRNSVTKGNPVETKNIYVDAYGVGDVGSIVLRDRQTLSSEGIVVAVLTLDGYGKLASRPKILSRGFVFEKGEDELFEGGMRIVEKLLKPRGERIVDMDSVKRAVADSLEDYFFKQRGRNPLIVVDVIQV